MKVKLLDHKRRQIKHRQAAVSVRLDLAAHGAGAKRQEHGCVMPLGFKEPSLQALPAFLQARQPVINEEFAELCTITGSHLAW
jgi:hypothetical protein